ncbi:hypothetical protein ACXDF8_14570 [Mycolicibacterium sp. CBM1]
MAAAAHRVRLSSSSVLLLGAATAVGFVILSQLLCKTRHAARLCYWIGSAATTALLGLGLEQSGRPLRVVFLAVALSVAFAVGFAYFVGWQLRIGGKTRSVFVKNTHPDPPEDGSEPPSLPPPPPHSYNGVVTADGFWWIAAILTSIIAADVYLFGWVWQSVIGAIALTAMGALAGADDASRGEPPARAQYVQAVVATIASLPLWLLPFIAYAVGYQFGKRRPRSGPGDHERHTTRRSLDDRLE